MYNLIEFIGNPSLVIFIFNKIIVAINTFFCFKTLLVFCIQNKCKICDKEHVIGNVFLTMGMSVRPLFYKIFNKNTYKE